MVFKTVSLLLLLPLVFGRGSDQCAKKVNEVEHLLKDKMEKLDNKLDNVLKKFNRILLTETELNRKLEKINAKLVPVTEELTQCIKRTSFAPVGIPHKDCALGMQSGLIEDSAVTASSSFKTEEWTWLPSGARLFKKDDYKEKVIGGWCPADLEGQVYLQIELETPRKITHVATQGRFDFDVYTKTFQLAYSEDGENFTVYQEGGLDKEFTTSRTSGDTLVYTSIRTPFTAKFIRFLPTTWKNSPCLRVELYSCGRE